MRVLVFGATGRTGSLVVQELLASAGAVAATPTAASDAERTHASPQGAPAAAAAATAPSAALHPLSVILYVRNPAKLPADVSSHPAVRVIRGDVRAADAIIAACEGCTAVINTLGHAYGETDSSWMTDCTRAILAGMARHGVRRLVDMTGVVNYTAQDATVVWFSVMRLFLRVAKPTVLTDHEARTALITASDVSWTILRPPLLTDGPRTGKFRLFTAATSDCGSTVSRADVAACMVQQLSDDAWVRQLPIITA